MISLRQTTLAVLFALGLLWATVAASLHGQAVTATLRGRVLDPSGDLVPNAKVTITNLGTNEQHSVTTGADGIYTFALLPRGDYKLTVEASGFDTNVHERISLEVGQSADLDVKLALGSQSSSVEVSATSTPVLQTENAALGGVVSQQSIQQLPLNLLNYQSLALLEPNVFLPAQNSSLGFRGGINIAGQSEVSNSFTLDGVDNMDEASNQSNLVPVLDAVQEFRVLSGNYAAEYGRASGGHVMVVTKSGTNSWHGSSYLFYRNSVLDARNYFATTKPTFSRKQYGATIGGPIRKDKVFFFASYGGLRAGSAAADLATVPTALMHQGNFSELAPGGCGGAGQPACLKNPFTGGTFAGDIIPQQYWSTQGTGLLTYYPTQGLLPGLARNLPQSTTTENKEDQTSGRIDWNATANTSLFVSYNYAHIPNEYPLQNSLCGNNLVVGFGCTELYKSQLLSVSMTHIFSPHVIWEGRFGFNRLWFSRIQDDSSLDVANSLGITGLLDAGAPNRPYNNGVPSLRVTGISTIGGATNLPQGRGDNDFNYISDLTILKGAHSIKLGVDIRRFEFNSFFNSDGRGLFTFNGEYTGNAIADLLLGLPSQATRDPGVPHQNTRDFSSDLYVQDDWKVKPNLTLNLGLRWELNLPPYEIDNRLETFDPATDTIIMAGGLQALPVINTAALNDYPNGPAWQGSFLQTQPYPSGSRLWNTQWKNFAPRLGFAWSPGGSDRWVIRGGSGVFFDQQELGNGISNSSRTLPFRLSQTYINTKAYNSSSTYDLANSFGGSAAGTLNAFGVTKNFQTATEAEWSLGVQRALTQNIVLGVDYTGSKGYNLPIQLNIGQALTPGGPRPEVGWAQVQQVYSVANSNFNALNVRFQKRFSNGASFLLAYAYSHSIDEGYGISTSSSASNTTPQNAYDFRGNRGSSDYDIRHRFVYNGLYDFPMGHGKRFLGNASGVTQALLGNWSISGILTVQTGPPYTLLLSTGFDNSETFGFHDLPNVVANPNQAGPVAANPTCKAPSVIHTPQMWLNPCAFIVPPKGQFGNEGRNDLVAPGLTNVDFSLIKNVRLGERANVELQAQFFNIFNHPNFGLPNNSIGSFNSATGVITDASLGTIASGPDENNTGAQRQIQFGVHFIF
jgi:Carboxypeptidase regulatory-like domain/TonB-dependent Receptor Plug Domain